MGTSITLPAQTRSELEKKYGAPERDKHNRRIFKVRPDVSLMAIFRKNGNPKLMKVASRTPGGVLAEKLTDEIIHEIWSSEELAIDKNGFSGDFASSQCNQQEYVTYTHFTMKTFKSCRPNSEPLEAGIESIEVTWKKMMLGGSKLDLRPDPRLR
jgi:hypothetical protein